MRRRSLGFISSFQLVRCDSYPRSHVEVYVIRPICVTDMHNVVQAIGMSSSTAYRSFNLAIDVLEVSPQDQIFRFDVEENRRIDREAPWKAESVSSFSHLYIQRLNFCRISPHYFKSCKISAIALIKMVCYYTLHVLASLRSFLSGHSC